jgi:hypothetical protein
LAGSSDGGAWDVRSKISVMVKGEGGLRFRISGCETRELRGKGVHRR